MLPAHTSIDGLENPAAIGASIHGIGIDGINCQGEDFGLVPADSLGHHFDEAVNGRWGARGDDCIC